MWYKYPFSTLHSTCKWEKFNALPRHFLQYEMLSRLKDKKSLHSILFLYHFPAPPPKKKKKNLLEVILMISAIGSVTLWGEVDMQYTGYISENSVALNRLHWWNTSLTWWTLIAGGKFQPWVCLNVSLTVNVCSFFNFFFLLSVPVQGVSSGCQCSRLLLPRMLWQ